MQRRCSAIASRLKSGALTSALLLGMGCGQAMAASGVNLCESAHDNALQATMQASLSESILSVEMETLTLDFIDHGDSSPLKATSQEDLEELDNELTYTIPLTPRVSAILRHIFDESVGSDQDEHNEELASGSPLAELRTPTHREIPAKFSKPLTTEPSVRETATPAAETRLPGIEEDEERRFRRQMFRTDI